MTSYPLYAALRDLLTVHFPAALPSFFPENLDIVQAACPNLTEDQRVLAAARLTTHPGASLALRRLHPLPHYQLLGLGGLLLAFSVPAEEVPALRPPADSARAVQAALRRLGLPEDRGQEEDTLRLITDAARLDSETVLAALALVPRLPHLAGALAYDWPPMFMHAALAGMVLGLELLNQGS